MKSNTLLLSAAALGGYSLYRYSLPSVVVTNEFNGIVYYKQKDSGPDQEPNELTLGQTETIKLDALSTPLFKDKIFLVPNGSKIKINSIGEIFFVGITDTIYNLYFPYGWLDKKSDWYQKKIIAADKTYDKLFSKYSSFFAFMK